MTDRYLAIPKAASYTTNGDDPRLSITADVIHEADERRVYTGLVDASGVGIYRVPETVPLGFKIVARS